MIFYHEQTYHGLGLVMAQPNLAFAILDVVVASFLTAGGHSFCSVKPINLKAKHIKSGSNR